MKKIILIVSSLLLVIFALPAKAYAQEASATPSAEVEVTPQEEASVPTEEFFQATVLSVEDKNQTNFVGTDQPIQKVKLRLLNGSEKDKEIEVDHGSLFAITDEQKVKTGDTVIITKTQGPTGNIYYITDRYRINSILTIFVFFFALVVLLGRKRGISAIAGLVISIFILIRFVIPRILAGEDPLLITMSAAVAIAILSLYMAHGLSRKTTIALVSTIFTLLIAAILAIVFVSLTNLTGTASEEAIFLRMGPFGDIDLKGLLLGGIIIGALGVLDDITVSQTAVVAELKDANPSLTKNELFQRGLNLGREHIASLINTLALAYAGASFPLLLLFHVGQQYPFWLTLNSEFITEEIVRTLVGSSALMLAVPISTFLAAHYLSKNNTNIVVAPVREISRRSTTRRPAKKVTKRARS